jgi:hypothetical protein
MLCSAHHLFSITFSATVFTIKAHAFAPSSGKPVSHIIPLCFADCANACKDNIVEMVAAAAFRLDFFIVAGLLQAAVTISFGHIPLSHIRTFILNSNILRADEVSGPCECDYNKTQALSQQRLPK